jgi:hypothetical protein
MVSFFRNLYLLLFSLGLCAFSPTQARTNSFNKAETSAFKSFQGTVPNIAIQIQESRKDAAGHFQISSSSRIKLERRHRKVLENSPELYYPHPNILNWHPTNSVSFAVPGGFLHSLLSDYLIRGPPSSVA